MDNIPERENLPPLLSPASLRVSRSVALFIERTGDSFDTLGQSPDFQPHLQSYYKEAKALEDEMLATGMFDEKREKTRRLLQDVISHVKAHPTVRQRIDRDLIARIHYGLEPLVSYLDNPQTPEIVIGDTRLTRNEVEAILKGMSGYAGVTVIEESEENLRDH